MLSNEGDNIVSIYSNNRNNIPNNINQNIHRNLNFSSKNTKTENNPINRNDININQLKSKKIKYLIISIVAASIVVITAVVVPVVLLTNKEEEDSKEKDNIQLSINEIKKTKYCIYSTLKMECNNLNHYSEIQLNDISLEFPLDNSTTKKYNVDSINGNFIEKKIPPEVFSGKVILVIYDIINLFNY